MSRAAVYGTLLAAAVVVVVVSCARNKEGRMSDRGAKTPVNVNVSCQGNEAKVSLTDNAGHPAWIVDMVDGKIRWEVKNHVTINGVVGKGGQQLPIEPDQNEPPGGGKPFKGKLKADAPANGTPVPYSLDVTCKQDGNTVRLIIDPEFIVHR